MDKLRIGLVQMSTAESKEANLNKAAEMIKRAAEAGVQLAVLPEMFNCPYNTGSFPQNAEPEGGETWQRLSRQAKEYRMFIVGGSIPELEDGRIYNTSYVFDNQGNQIGKHRKMHLFDIDVEGGQYFKESDTLSAGNTGDVIDTPFGKIGVMICYDIRFPELARMMVQKGARFLIIPGAFNMTTGPAHWEILFRIRALDNQVYAMGCAPARNVDASYISYANSIIVDPWGTIINKLEEAEGLLIEDLDLTKIDKVRRELPLLKHRRTDIYELRENK